MNLIAHCQNDVSLGEEVGTISVSIFKNQNGLSSFTVNAENDNVLQVSYVIEDTLKMY